MELCTGVWLCTHTYSTFCNSVCKGRATMVSLCQMQLQQRRFTCTLICDNTYMYAFCVARDTASKEVGCWAMNSGQRGRECVTNGRDLVVVVCSNTCTLTQVVMFPCPASTVQITITWTTNNFYRTPPDIICANSQLVLDYVSSAFWCMCVLCVCAFCVYVCIQ